MISSKQNFEFWIKCIIFFLVVITCILGIWGFAIAYHTTVPLSPEKFSGALADQSIGTSSSVPDNSLDFLYSTLQLFTMGSGAQVDVNNWQLEIARFLAPLLALSTLLIVFWTLFDRSRFLWLFLNPGHVVICGCGYLGPAIARYYVQKENRFVVIVEKDPDNPSLDMCRELGVMVVGGDATHESVLRQVRIFIASEIFLVTGNDDTNAEIAVLCEKVTGEHRRWRDLALMRIVNRIQPQRLSCSPGIPRCHIHLEDSLLSKTLCLSHPVLKGGNDAISREFFNLYRIAGYCVQKIKPESFTKTEIRLGRRPHLMIIGFGRMGENLVVQAVKRWKMDKYDDKLLITVVGKNAKKQLEEIRKWYPSIDNYCRITPVEKESSSLGLHELQDLFRNLLEPVSRVYICNDNSSKALSIALLLIEKIGLQDTPVIVRSYYKDGMTQVIQSFRKQGTYRTIHPFPIVESQCCMDLITGGLLEALAKVIHEDYVRKRTGSDACNSADPALRPWLELDESYKESNRSVAKDIRRKLNKIGFDIAPLTEWIDDSLPFSETELELLAKDEHERWMKEKREAGYMLGKMRDDNLKTSPWLISFEQLPWEEQEKDRDIIRNIPRLLERVDLRIVRNSALFRSEIAQKIHAKYLEQNRDKTTASKEDPALKPWNQLDESLQQSNIEQADDIFNKLHKIGCSVFYTGKTDEPLFSFTDEEIEILAFQEHDRWIKERMNKGWVYGTEKDILKKTSPYLIPFDKLSEDDKEKDRKPVREYPQLLASVGLKIFRKATG